MDQGYAFEDQGIRFYRLLTEHEWDDLGAALVARQSAVQWLMGDWLIHSDIRGPIGERYERALDVTGLSESTLLNYVMVATAYPFGQRVPGASWTRHLLASRLPGDQRMLVLRQSVEEGWKTIRFNETVRRLTEEYVRANLPAGLKAGDRVHGPAVRGYRGRHTGKGMVYGVKCPFCENVIPRAKLHTYKAAVAQEVECIPGTDEVTGSTPVSGSTERPV